MAYVDSSGASVWWDETSASGESVLLINGLGSPSTTWYRLVRRLTPRFRVLTFDNRGVGRTGVPLGPYPVSAMAADAAAVLDAAGVDSAHVVGLSMGGLIAQELALEDAGRVRTLVLAATHRGIPHLEQPEPTVLEAMTSAGELPPPERDAALATLLYARQTPRIEIDRDFAARRYPTDPAGYRNQLTGVLAWERAAELARIKVPTLVLHGTADRIVPPSNGAALAAAIPSARLHLLEGAGHALFTDREESAATAVTDFFENAAHPAPSST
jgi:3-oxoadipate enol-lactonase